MRALAKVRAHSDRAAYGNGKGVGLAMSPNPKGYVLRAYVRTCVRERVAARARGMSFRFTVGG